MNGWDISKKVSMLSEVALMRLYACWNMPRSMQRSISLPSTSVGISKWPRTSTSNWPIDALPERAVCRLLCGSGRRSHPINCAPLPLRGLPEDLRRVDRQLGGADLGHAIELAPLEP